MNMVMKEVLLKFVHVAQHHMDVPNYNFVEMLIILEEAFAHLKAQAPTTKAYDSLSKKINMSFQCVFEHLSELKSNPFASKEGPSHARGGEQQREPQKTFQWRSISEFALRGEDSDI